MKILLVRHGVTAANAEGRLQGHADVELSVEGADQAERLHRRFTAEGLCPTHVYSSPLLRTAETARIVSRSWDLPIVHWDDLKETDVGAFTGLTMAEAADRFPEMTRAFLRDDDWDAVENAEGYRQRNERARRVVDRVIADHADGDVVALFAHGGILQCIVAALLGTQRVWSVTVANTAVFEFEIDLERWRRGSDLQNNRRWRILRFNDAEHLR